MKKLFLIFEPAQKCELSKSAFFILKMTVNEISQLLHPLSAYNMIYGSLFHANA